jgi:hypothetical protein
MDFPAKDLLVAGTPGPLLRWTCDLVAAAVALIDPAAAAVRLDPETAWSPEQADGGLRLWFAEQIDAALAAAVRDGRVRAALVLDDPARGFATLRQSGCDAGAALRALTASITVLGELHGAPAAMLLMPDRGAACEAAQAVLAHLGVLPPPDALAELAGRFGVDGPQATLADAALRHAADAPAPDSLSGEDAALVEAILVPAQHYAATGERRGVVWPRACLFWGDRPGELAPRVLQLAGPARVLVYGPYFRLAAGRWTARATVAFSPTCRGAPMALELHGSTGEIARRHFPVREAGLFAVVLPVVVPSAHEPLEVRLVTERGAIEGELGIDRIEFTPMPDDSAAAREETSPALRERSSRSDG